MSRSRSLIQALIENFNIDDLRGICLDLRIDPDEFSPPKSAFVTNLFNELEISNRLVELVNLCKELRPKTDWGNLLSLYYSPPFSATPKTFSKDIIKTYCELFSKKEEIARWADSSTTDFYIQAEGKFLPIFAAPYIGNNGHGEFLVPLILSRQFLIVLGEPGTGKSVALKRVAWELADNLIERIPIYIPLLKYDGDMWELVRKQIIQVREEDKGINLPNIHSTKLFLEEVPCHFLFDGLNEMPGEYAEEGLRSLIQFMSENEQHYFVITSRSQDKLWRKLLPEDVTKNAVIVQRISNQQTKEYLVAHLGYKKGTETYDRLNKRMKDLARTPFLLYLIKDAGLNGREIPGNRGELFESFVDQIIYRDMRLESNLDLWAEKKELMIDSLAYLAYQLQKKNKLICTYKYAKEQISYYISTYYYRDDQQILNTGILNNWLHSILSDAQKHGFLVRAEKAKFTFMHQSLHEYFVARYLKIILHQERVDTSVIAKLKGMFGNTVIYLAKDDRWADSFVQLAGIEENPSRLVLELLPVKPWLAFWCSIEGKPIKEAVQDKINELTIKQLLSEYSNRRIEALGELGRMRNPRTIKYILPLLADQDADVQKLASNMLAELGEPAVGSLHALLFTNKDKYDVNARWAAFRTLGRMWNRSDIELLGSKSSYDRKKAVENLDIANNRQIVLLIATLRDDVVEVRDSVVKILVSQGDTIVDILINCIRNNDWKIQEGAIKALGNIKASKAVDHLIQGLRNINHNLVLISIADALANIGDKRAIEPLTRSLEGNDYLVRIKIQQAINRLLRE